MVKRLIDFINFRRGQATDLLMFKTGKFSIRGILTTSIVKNMANAPSGNMAKWVEYDFEKHGNVTPISRYQSAGASGHFWLEPTKRGKFWMIIVLLTGLYDG